MMSPSPKGMKPLSFRTQWRFIREFALLMCLFITGTSAFAACHVVTPSGSGAKTGADWNNAYAGVPSTLIRGDVYYLADGNYPAYAFTTAASGTLTLEIRKAQTYDHCTDTGWNAGTMGAAQAVFKGASTPLIKVNTSYVTVNGNGKLTAPGCGGAPGASYTSEAPTPADCGIRVDNTGCTSGNADACDSPISVGGATNYTFEYVELVGNGNNASDKIEIQGPYGGSGPSLFNHIYARNAGCVYMQYGGTNRTVSFSYFWGTEVNGAPGGCHGQAEFYSPPDSNYTNHDNVYRDITGTAIWTWANPGSGTSNDLTFYNNVIFNSSTFAKPNGSLAFGTTTDGILACINPGVNCTNVSLYQNTVVNKGWGTGVNNENTGSYTIQNNLWYQTYNANGNPGGISFMKGSGGAITQDHNSFLQAGSGNPSGTANVSDASAPDPFTNWTASNFNIASENADWTNRLTLGPPYTTDPNGTTRTTDRGAYQISTVTPAPPVNVQATPQ